MNITVPQLETIFPKARHLCLSNVKDPLNQAMEEFNIDTPQRCAGFIAQCAQECGLFTAFVENLNYTSAGLIATWPSRFTTLDLAKQYEHQPEKIANFVYANRLGNGNTDSGDGWLYRGRGMIGITGRTNYFECGQALGQDLIVHPEYLETLEGAARSAAWFWKTHKLNAAADADDIIKMTLLINGGHLGLYERTQYYEAAKKVLVQPLEPVVTVVTVPEPITEPAAPSAKVTSIAPPISFIGFLIDLLKKLFKL